MSQISVKQINLAQNWDFAENVSIASGKGITMVDAPDSDTELANKLYVDTQVAGATQGLDVRKAVHLASTANVAVANGLEAGDTIDSVVLVAGDRVLLKDQTSATENGVYIAVASGAGAASRAADMDAGAEVSSAFFFVQDGTDNGGNGYICLNHGTITLGSTALEFEQFSGAGQIQAGSGLEKDGNQLALDIKANSGLQITSSELDIRLKGESGGTISVDSGGLYIANSAISNAKLATSTISGVALGATLRALSATSNGGVSMTSYTGTDIVGNVQLDFKAQGGTFTIASGDTRASNVITEASIVVDHDLLASAHPLYGHVAVYRNGVLFGTRVIDGSTPNAAGEWALVDNGDNLDLKLFETTDQDFTGDEFKLSAMVQPV